MVFLTWTQRNKLRELHASFQLAVFQGLGYTPKLRLRFLKNDENGHIIKLLLGIDTGITAL